MAVVIANPNNSVVAAGEAQVQVQQALDVPTALTQQFIHKLRARQADRKGIEEASGLFRAIRFEDYEESCSARLMQFEHTKSDDVIEKLCSSNGWDQHTSEDLKFAAALLDEDRKAETWIKFQKGQDGEFYVHFVALKRMGDKVHMGLARHYVKFKLSPFAKDPESERRHGRFFYNWWENVDKQRPSAAYPAQGESRGDGGCGDGEQRGLSLHEMAMLENYFLLKSMIKFTETFPIHANRLPDEDRQYLTMGPSDGGM